MILGIYLAIIELSIIFLSGHYYKKISNFRGDIISFFWLYFTFFTGIWEFSYLLFYNKTCEEANILLESKEHVWTNRYSIINIIPPLFSVIFYSEYGAYADREYMLPDNNWSRTIEGTHCIFCGAGALLALYYIKHKYYFVIFSMLAMSSQVMNSILYIVNYFHQTRDPDNPNFNTTQFPTGTILNDRPFMYINILWTIMPIYVIFKLLMD
jgi:hypothetical protein